MEAPMEKMTNEQYVEAGGICCPYCKCANIRVTSRIETGDTIHAFQDCKCNNCGKEWTEEYVLTGYTESDNSDDEDSEDDDGTSGQDREGYTDDQDRQNYT